MITQLPTVPPAVMRAANRTLPAASSPHSRAPSAHDPGSWRYVPVRPLHGIPWTALAVSGVMHAWAIFGFNDKTAPAAPVGLGEDIPTIALEMPPLDELKEPDEVYDSDTPQEELDPGQYVPMQADIPSIATDATFVQQMDLNSLLPKPDFDSAKVVTIPPRIAHGSVNPNQIKDLFDLGDLDRVPTPLLQQPPVFPAALKHEVSHAEVVVDFIVDANGRVPWAKVYSSTHRGFEDAAVLGVSRWQFRPGMKNGKKVATRMRVPLQFRVVDDEAN